MRHCHRRGDGIGRELCDDHEVTSMDTRDAEPAPQVITHLDPAQRAALGRAARQAVPRSSHAVWEPTATRADPVGLLHEQEKSRVPELVPLRHERMLESAFTFYRGAAVIMANDLGATPNSGLQVQACGDAHLANFGGFAAPDRRLVFDINDFDETTPGPFEWDIKRLAASFEIAARAREFSAKTTRSIVLEVTKAYREAMAEFATMSNLDVWYSRLDAATIIDRWRSQASPDEVRRFERMVTKAEGKSSLKALSKLTRVVDGDYQIVNDPPVVVRLRDLLPSVDAEAMTSWLQDQFRVYRSSLQPDRRNLLESYRLVDFARKVVGVGSVGTRCWIALLLGKDASDPLFLQIKEAEASVLEPYAGKSEYEGHGERVVEGQRWLQAAGDILLGWAHVVGLDGAERDFYVRQLWDWKVAADTDTMLPAIFPIYAQMCGSTLARGHARSGDRIAIAAYLGSGDVFDKAIADFAVAYADQNERDYAAAKASL
jgi:uncharacterized protein (DUF2252 family)